MIKKDYIQRLTQQIAQLIALLMGKDTKESLQIIEEAYFSWFKLSSQNLASLSADEMIPFLYEEKGLSIHHLELLAEIMAQEGQIYFNENEKAKTKNILKKALILFEFVDGKQELYSLKRQATMIQIKNQLADT